MRKLNESCFIKETVDYSAFFFFFSLNTEKKNQVFTYNFFIKTLSDANQLSMHSTFNITQFQIRLQPSRD